MAKYVSDAFNSLCTELGVQCLVTLNPRSYKLNYVFENLGKDAIALFNDTWFQIIPPTAKLVIELSTWENMPWMTIWHEQE